MRNDLVMDKNNNLDKYLKIFLDFEKQKMKIFDINIQDLKTI